ncbi:MAG: 23S rRNA (uracil(1939)-C(5))-methyltransferase RlmD, partial [bacterium]
IETPSAWRTLPRCAHFGVCGGCRLQHIVYEKQLEFKESQVSECLQHIGGLREVTVRKIAGMSDPWYYRNKMEFTFGTSPGGEVLLGMHEAGRFDRIVDVTECHLQPALCNDVVASVRDFARRYSLMSYDPRARHSSMDRHMGLPLLKNLVVRAGSDGENYMLCLVTTPGDFPQIAQFREIIRQNFPQVKSMFWYRNPLVSGVAIAGEGELLCGEHFIEEKIGGIALKVSPSSFVQINRAQAQMLYATIVEFAGLSGDETVVDLYTGTGPIALLLAGGVKKVIAVESNADAVSDARWNAEKNGIGNVEFIEGAVEKLFLETAEKNKPDVVVADPPRAGIHKKAMRALLKTLPRRIVYVSCNPATLARDVKIFVEGGYDVTAVQPVDMFPHTPHIEAVARLDRKI